MTDIKSESLSVVLAAGASGGHIAPALAIAASLKKLEPKTEITFVGVGREVEKKMLDESGFDYQSIPFSPVLGRSIFKLFKLILRLPPALLECRKLFKSKNVDVVVGFGGFPCFVPVLYAWLARKKIILHEQNVKSGLANRVLCKFAGLVFAPQGSDIPVPSKKLKHLPNPVRDEFYSLQSWSQHNDPLKLLVLGGSQGARNINNAVMEIIPFLKEKNISLTHQTGRNDFKNIEARYMEKSFIPLKCQDFFDNIEELIENSDIVVSRAGAMAVAELSAAGRACIFVPLSISRAHQSDNIKELVDNDGAILVEDNENLSEALEAAINSLDLDRNMMFEMSKRMKALSTHKGEKPSDFISNTILQF